MAASVSAAPAVEDTKAADTLIMNAKVTTWDIEQPSAEAVAIKGGKILAVDSTAQVMQHHRGPATKVIDAGQRRLIPGLNDSHSHYLRGGNSFTGELPG